MKKNKISLYSSACALCLCLGITDSSYSMGLRSFVALPVEKGGAVIRLSFEHAKDTDTDSLTTSAAYGFTATQTLLLGMPYRLSSTEESRQGDISVLYRHIVWQDDSPSGTDRLGLLGGVVVPTENDRDTAVQAGFVFTHFKNRHEIDVDALYRVGVGSRADSALYDISWQYRLYPVEYPDWGLSQEINTILELNGRWNQGNNMTHQITAGLQWIHQKLVIEGGIVKDINNDKETRYILSTRFHF